MEGSEGLDPQWEIRHRPEDVADITDMLGKVAVAVAHEDHAQLLEITDGQDLLVPSEIAEYLDVKARQTIDPLLAMRWKSGLQAYLISLEGKVFPEEEEAVITNLQFREAISNSEVGKESILPEDEFTQDPEGWEADHFEICLDPETAKKISKNGFYLMAKEIVAGNAIFELNQRLPRAVGLIDSDTKGVKHTLLRKAFDVHVFNHAKMFANGFRDDRSVKQLIEAKNLVEVYASSEVAAFKMNSALDKYVRKLAVDPAAYAREGFGMPMKQFSRVIIDEYASSPGRRDAMLKSLGLM